MIRVVTPLQFSSTPGLQHSLPYPCDCQREERLVIAVKRQAVIGLLLKQFSAQEKEQQSRQRIEVAFTTPAGHLVNTLTEQRHDARGDGHIDGEHPLPQAAPSRSPVVGGAVEKHRQGQRNAQPAREPAERRSAEAVQPQIGREVEQHDVAEGESRHAQLQPQASP